MSVKCVDCRYAEWQKTPTGRIKPKVCGRCTAVVPDPISVMCVRNHPRPHKGGIWPDMEGKCDLYEVIP